MNSFLYLIRREISPALRIDSEGDKGPGKICGGSLKVDTRNGRKCRCEEGLKVSLWIKSEIRKVLTRNDSGSNDKKAHRMSLRISVGIRNWIQETAL